MQFSNRQKIIAYKNTHNKKNSNVDFKIPSLFMSMSFKLFKDRDGHWSSIQFAAHITLYCMINRICFF